jgi:hypothetical protein
LLEAPFHDLFALGVGEALLEDCLPALMAGTSHTQRLPLLTQDRGRVVLELTATSTSFAQEEILWALMETGAAAA